MEKETEVTKIEPKGSKQITETKCICSACGNVWFYGKKEITDERSNSMHNAGKAMMCCGGCFPAMFIPNKQEIDLNKCPKCGSRAIKKEIVTHNV